MKHLKPDDRSVRDLFEQKRRVATSRDPAERLGTIFLRLLLRELLEQSTNAQVGDLLSMVQGGLGLFSPDFVVVEHAKRRLQRRHSWRHVK